MDAQPHDYGAEQTARRSRVLSGAGSESEVEFARICPPDQNRRLRANYPVGQESRSTAATFAQDASGVFKDRREPGSIGIAMPVGWDQSGAPAAEQEPQVRAGRRASDAKNGGAWGFAPPSRLVGLCRLGLLFRLGGWLRRGLLAVSALSLAANCYPAQRWRSAPGICRRSSPKNS